MEQFFAVPARVYEALRSDTDALAGYVHLVRYSTVQDGQTVLVGYTTRSLANLWKWGSHMKVHRLLNKLEKLGFIALQKRYKAAPTIHLILHSKSEPRYRSVTEPVTHNLDTRKDKSKSMPKKGSFRIDPEREIDSWALRQALSAGVAPEQAAVTWDKMLAWAIDKEYTYHGWMKLFTKFLEDAKKCTPKDQPTSIPKNRNRPF